MKQSKRKKKRSGPSKSPHEIGSANGGFKDDEQRTIQCLVEAFSLTSVEKVKTVYEQTGRDADKAAEILSGLSEKFEDQTASSSSSRFSGSSSDEYNESNHGKEGVNCRGFRGNKGKKVVAATGTVSTVLGKDYVPAASRKEITSPRRSKVNVEEFVRSMLGDECELRMAVVKDVLGQCGYDVNKATDILLDLSGSSFDSSGSDKCSLHSGSSGEDSKYSDFSYESFWQLSDRSDSTSHSSEDNGWPVSYGDRSYSEVLVGSNSSKGQLYTDAGSNKFELPHEVLESLFSIPRRPSVHEPNTMNWRNVVKKLESFAQKRHDLCSLMTSTSQQITNVKGDGYSEFRGTAVNRWNTMKANYEKAAMAYSNGSKEHASYLSDRAKQYGKSAQEADERASMEIFKARNKDKGNVLSIDLHGQHVKPAMRLVKLHLLFGTFFLKIITGGSHGVGKSKLKQSVISLMKNEGIQWREENQGMILIKLEGPREFSFLDSESDSDFLMKAMMHSLAIDN
ncbi:hypothetical protein V2J09_019109 [Rumex salicifolius]